MTATDAAITPEAPAAPVSRLRAASILATATMVTMLYAMTVTIANVALPQMQGSLAATQDQIAWIVTFNIVATAVVTPMAGWLTGRFGRRRLLLLTIVPLAASCVSAPARRVPDNDVVVPEGWSAGPAPSPLMRGPMLCAVCITRCWPRQRTASA